MAQICWNVHVESQHTAFAGLGICRWEKTTEDTYWHPSKTTILTMVWRHTLTVCFISGFHCVRMPVGCFFCDDRETWCAFCTTFVNGKSRVVLLSLLSALFCILLLAWCIACWVGCKTTDFAKKLLFSNVKEIEGGPCNFFNTIWVRVALHDCMENFSDPARPLGGGWGQCRALKFSPIQQCLPLRTNWIVTVLFAMHISRWVYCM